MGAKERYEAFAAFEAAGSSSIYEQLSNAIATDDLLLALIEALPEPKQQPNLLLAASQLLGAPMGSPPETLAFIHDHRSEVHDVITSHSTQTNEAARTGTFLPLLAAMDGPVALIEVGCSAGLCLYPDRYAITYDEMPPIGPADSAVRFPVRTYGPVPVPTRNVDIVARIGIDLNPLNVRRPEDVAWLDACIWPEHTERRQRLRAAAALVASDPPELVRGDAVETIDDVLGSLHRDVTPVVIHSAVLAYLTPDARAEFSRRVLRHAGTRWISNESPGVVPTLDTSLTPPADRGAAAYFVLGVDGTDAAGLSDPHGQWLKWNVGHTQIAPT
ncbi:MAG: DUF2332 domain-containing protein [Microthrixaceae bacterium]